ncbi:MAG: hypothetical protein ACUVXI_06780 [bacterium]
MRSFLKKHWKKIILGAILVAAGCGTVVPIDNVRTPGVTFDPIIPTGADNIPGGITGLDNLLYLALPISIPEEANPKKTEGVDIESAKLTVGKVINNTKAAGNEVWVNLAFYVSTKSGEAEDRGEPIPLKDKDGNVIIFKGGETLDLETDNIPALIEGIENGKFWLGYHAIIDATSPTKSAPTGVFKTEPPYVNFTTEWKLTLEDVKIVINGEVKPVELLGGCAKGCSAVGLQ